MVYFIGDCHFGDKNILRYDRRPFSNIKEMDDKLIQYWNETVLNDTDEVFVTGDFGAKDYEKHILYELRGIKHLIKGNHDIQDNDYYRRAGFVEVYDYPIIKDNFWIISHEPMYISEYMPYANIFAHVHNNPMYKTVSSRSFCTSADRIGLKPISFDEIKKQILSLNNS